MERDALSRLNDRAVTAMELGAETRNVEFKRGAPLDSLKYKVVRAALAMANLRDGGTLIIGMPESSDDTARGVSTSDGGSYEQDAVLALVNSFAASPIELYIVRFPFEDVDYVFMHVLPFRRAPIICRKNTPDNTAKNERLEAACLYVRIAEDKIETSRVRTPAQMEELLEMATEQRARELLSSAQRIGFRPPEDARRHFDDELGGLRDLF